jgi:hypothetical protein
MAKSGAPTPGASSPGAPAPSPAAEGPKASGIHVNLGFADFTIPLSKPIAYLLAAAAVVFGSSWVYQNYIKPYEALVPRKQLEQLLFEAGQYEVQLNSVQFTHSLRHVANPQEGEPLKSPMKNLGLTHFKDGCVEVTRTFSDNSTSVWFDVDRDNFAVGSQAAPGAVSGGQARENQQKLDTPGTAPAPPKNGPGVPSPLSSNGVRDPNLAAASLLELDQFDPLTAAFRNQQPMQSSERTVAGCSGRCLNPHPDPAGFRFWYGQANGCWVQVWRQWPDGCTHYQWFNTCNNSWDGDASGRGVYWTCCVH